MSDWLADRLGRLQAETDAAAAIADQLTHAPVAAQIGPGWQLTEVIKAQGGRAVARIEGPDDPAIAKLYADRAAAEAAAAEITRAHAAMSGIPGSQDLTPALLAHVPGLIVQAHAPGRNLRHVIAEAEPPARAALFARAARWLDAYAGPEREIRQFSAGFWLKRARGRTGPQTCAAHRPLITALLDRMADLAGRVDAQPIGHGYSHADFADHNLHLDGDRVWGFDLEGTARMPVIFDVANFLVATAGYHGVGAQVFCGTDGAGARAMRATGVIPEGEWGPLMGFFTAERLVHHLGRSPIERPARMATARRWLETA